jgi:hypothetical protein
MQRVTCFSQVKFEETDTCPRDKKWLERLTKFVHTGNTYMMSRGSRIKKNH